MPFNIDEQYIIKAENELGVRFPQSYRQKMINENGGAVYVPYNAEELTDAVVFYLHPLFDTSDKKRMSRTCNHVIKETKTSRDDYGLDLNLIVIGSNESSHWLVLRINENGILDDSIYIRAFSGVEIEKVASDFSKLKTVKNDDENY